MVKVKEGADRPAATVQQADQPVAAAAAAAVQPEAEQAKQAEQIEQAMQPERTAMSPQAPTPSQHFPESGTPALGSPHRVENRSPASDGGSTPHGPAIGTGTFIDTGRRRRFKARTRAPTAFEADISNFYQPLETLGEPHQITPHSPTSDTQKRKRSSEPNPTTEATPTPTKSAKKKRNGDHVQLLAL